MSWLWVLAPLIVALLAIVLAVSFYVDAARRNAEIGEAYGAGRKASPGRLEDFRRFCNTKLRGTRFGRNLTLRLDGASLPLGPFDYVAVLVLGCGAIALICAPVVGYVGAVLLMAFGWYGAGKYLEQRRRKRAEKFVSQLPELARVLGNAASAGLSLRKGIEIVSREMDEPAAEEFAEVARLLSLGSHLESALDDLTLRLPSRELTVLVKTLTIQARAGGALVSALTKIAQTLEDRKELNREIKTLTSGVVYSGYAVVGVGILSVFLVNFISPGALDKLTQSLIGQAILVIALLMFVVGQILVQRIAKVVV